MRQRRGAPPRVRRHGARHRPGRLSPRRAHVGFGRARSRRDGPHPAPPRATGGTGRVVIFSVHQPSPRTFRAIDNVILLGPGGKRLWSGSPRDADEFFTRAGLPCPEEDLDGGTTGGARERRRRRRNGRRRGARERRCRILARSRRGPVDPAPRGRPPPPPPTGWTCLSGCSRWPPAPLAAPFSPPPPPPPPLLRPRPPPTRRPRRAPPRRPPRRRRPPDPSPPLKPSGTARGSPRRACCWGARDGRSPGIRPSSSRTSSWRR